MTSTPDFISMSDLEKLQDEAQLEEDVNRPTGPYAGFTEEQVINIVTKALDDMTESCPHPMAGKVAIMTLIERMIAWHSRVGREIIAEHNSDEAGVSAMCWLRDAGKFQAMANILSTVSMGDGDFMMSEE